MTVTALARMEKLHGIRCCPKCAPKKERKKFNVAAQRAEAFDGDDKRLVKQGIVAVKKERAQKQKAADAPQRAPTSLAEEATGKGVPKWKAQSSALRDAMKQMREIKKAEESGVPLSALPPAPRRHRTRASFSVRTVAVVSTNRPQRGTFPSVQLSRRSRPRCVAARARS